MTGSFGNREEDSSDGSTASASSSSSSSLLSSTSTASPHSSDCRVYSRQVKFQSSAKRSVLGSKDRILKKLQSFAQQVCIKEADSADDIGVTCVIITDPDRTTLDKAEKILRVRIEKEGATVECLASRDGFSVAEVIDTPVLTAVPSPISTTSKTSDVYDRRHHYYSTRDRKDRNRDTTFDLLPSMKYMLVTAAVVSLAAFAYLSWSNNTSDTNQNNSSNSKNGSHGPRTTHPSISPATISSADGK